ncbi:hypothetical protein LPJ78_002719 [Coemansia sp. RSA 989]|nr:hypothetical protein LPJ68_001975 [Coemansia sp. RSA 1086]KAJ1865457.1 hypothetical protein LPJ78_002719 [Coemansia sp. RSA 989]KAJ2674434.1 hypothetical protein IWW42_001604 [Coemansia sp. RSA 1085]
MADTPDSKPGDTTVDWSRVRIHGTGNGSGSFTPTINHHQMMVDKSLVCRALLDIDAAIVRVCAPAGFGKTLNLKIISTVFNILNCNDMPGPQFYYPNIEESKKKLDLDVASGERIKLVESLLIHEEEAFFSQHFCRYPVLSINFSTINSARSLQQFCSSLVRRLNNTVHFWIFAFHVKQLEQAQRELYQGLTDAYSEAFKKLRSSFNDPQEGFKMYCALFSRLAAFLASVCAEKHIILVDGYDAPLVACQNKPWEQQAQHMYSCVLKHMLKDNEQLLKCVFAGVYNMPLDGLDMLTVAPAINMCYNPRSSAEILGAMFGITHSELNELCGILQTTEQEVASFGGCSFAHNTQYCSAKQIMKFYRLTIRNRLNNKLAYHPVPQPAKIVKTIIREASPQLFILALRLLNGSGDTCFIWPSWELRAEHCHSADELLFNFVFDPSAHPGNINSLDKIVTLLVYLGYLTISGNNALQIPDNGMRDMWENLRLLATFGTIVPTQQDTMRQQIIDSLYTGNTDLLHAEFTNALKILASNTQLSLQAQLEYICRWILSKLTLSSYTFARCNANFEYDQKFLANPRLNTPWTITLLPFGRYIQPLKVVLCFAQSPNTGSYSLSADIAIGK